MLKIWRNRKFRTFFLYIVLFGTVGGGLIVFILKESGALEVKGIEEKYIYDFESNKNDYSRIYVAENIESARYWTEFVEGKTDQFIGSDEIKPIKSFVKVKVLEYNADSTFALIYTKYKYGTAPRIKTRKGFVPTFILHDTVPKGVKPIPYYTEK